MWSTMSDILASQSDFATSTSQFDATSLDKNLQSIAAVERTWRSPALPDEVKLDLAMQPGVNPEGLTSFLQQVDDDLSGSSRGDVEEEEPEPDPGPARDERSGYDLARVVFSDLAGEPDPTSPDIDAVTKFKQDAIARGYLDEDTPIDDAWDPELNSIRWEMAFDDYDNAMRGDRYGAVDARNFIDVLGDWTQPTSLLAAATELDLWWDFGAVRDEFSNWGEKFQKLQDSNNPWEFGKNLVDALTGPVDDIVMPIVNYGLILSGIGGVYTGARLSAFGAKVASKGGKVGSFVNGLYRTSEVRAAANLKALGEPSWTATKLMSKSPFSMMPGTGFMDAVRMGSQANGLPGATGAALRAWRANQGVVRGKQAAQAGMRLGFTAQAQELLPGYQGGRSLADIGPVGDFADRVREVGHNPLFTPIELAVAPYNIFSPGTFIGRKGLISKTASGLYKVSGNDIGRTAVGATIGAGAGTLFGDDLEDIGVGALAGGVALGAAPYAGKLGNAALQRTEALLEGSSFAGSARLRNGLRKYVGTPSDFLETMSFKPIVDNQQNSMAFDRAYRRVLEAQDPSGAALARYQEGWKKTGTLSGAIGIMEGVDAETGAAIVTWRMMTAALDQVAAAKAGMTASGSFKNKYHNIRNALVGQLRTFDLDNVSSWTLEDLARSMHLNKYSAEDPQRYNKLVKDTYDRLVKDPSWALDMANTHNMNAQQTLKELLDPRNLNEEAIFDHLGATQLEFGRWPAFTSADSQITDALHAGLLTDAEFKTWINAGGNASKFRAGGPKIKTSTKLIQDGLTETVIAETTDLSRTVLNRNLSTLVTEAPSGRLTPMRIGTATAQDMTSFSAQLKRLRNMMVSLRQARASGIDWRKVEQIAGAPLSELDSNQMKAALRAVGGAKFEGTGATVVDMAKVLGIDPHTMIAQADDFAQAILDDTDTWARFGLGATVRGDETGEMLTGLEALKRRIRQLDREAHFTASEVDLDGLIAKLRQQGNLEAAERVQDLADGLASDGYKLVYGKEFMAPHDLLQEFKPFEDITTRHLHAETMGNVFRRRLPAERRLMEETRHKLAVANEMSKTLGRDVHPDDPRVTEAMYDLRNILDEIQGRASASVDKLWQENWFRRRVASMSTSFTPLRTDDLFARQKELVEGLVARGYDRPVADAIWKASTKFRSSEFNDVGLYGIEAWLRKNDQGAQFLKFATGGRGKGLLSGRGAYTAVGAYSGYQVGRDFGPESEEGNLGAGILGGIAGAALGYGAARGVSAVANATGDGAGIANRVARGTRLAKEGGAAGFDAAGEVVPVSQSLIQRAEASRHGYIADRFAQFRDSVRFTLSPFFDISRYTEGMMLAQTAAPMRAADGSRLALHLNMSPTALRKRWIRDMAQGMDAASATAASHKWFDEQRRLFRAAAKGDFDPDVLDSTGRWFSQIGIMGFNPTDWMAAAFTELRHVGGFDPETAYKAVREMYTYGTNGRSAAELSVNFLLFPFSFQKKALTHLGKWMNQDLGRSILIHDAFQTYKELDERYNLNDYWRDHVPMLEQLNKLNLFAFGISGGSLGGINRPYIEPFVRGATEYAQAMFTPVGASITDAAKAAEFQDTFRRLLPAINDINWMAESARQQANVFTSESGLTIDAEIRQGYAEFNEYREGLSDYLESIDATWGDLRNKPYLASQWAAYEAKRAELGRKYPAWADARTRSTQNRVALEIEKNDHLARAAAGVEVNYEDVAVARMEDLLERMKYEAGLRGQDVGGSEGWHEAPPQMSRFVRQVGINELQGDRRFLGVWEKFYRKEFGPLEAKV